MLADGTRPPSLTSSGESVNTFTDLKCERACCEAKEKAEEQKAHRILGSEAGRAGPMAAST